jgi:hypothetical protein
MISIREVADSTLHGLGFRDYMLKVKENRGSKRFPAYDVFVRESGAKRGRQVLTLICPDFRIG